MREWTDFTKEWLKSAPDVLFHGEGRYRLHNAITMALELKPRVKTTWLRLLQDADRERKAKGDWQEPLDAVLDNLKEMVVAEELVVANEEFKARDMQSGETYLEYKMGLYSIGGVAYELYSYGELTEKVLDRFLLGCGEAGPSIRLQAPKDLQEAIAKAIAYDNEKARNEGGKEEKTIFAFHKAATNRIEMAENHARHSKGAVITVAKRATNPTSVGQRNHSNHSKNPTRLEKSNVFAVNKTVTRRLTVPIGRNND